MVSAIHSLPQPVEVALSSNPYPNLREIDFENQSNLANTNLNLTYTKDNVTQNLVPALETLNIRGTNVKTINLASYTPVKNIYLSDHISEFDYENLPFLEVLEIRNTVNAENLKIANCPKLNQYEVLKNFNGLNIGISLDNLQVDYDNALTQAFMSWLISCNADLQGEVYVQSINEETLEPYRQAFPKLTIKLYQIFPDEVVFGIAGEGE